MSQKVDRRRFLIGTGTLIALPFFESLWPTRVLAQVASAPNVIVLSFRWEFLKTVGDHRAAEPILRCHLLCRF